MVPLLFHLELTVVLGRDAHDVDLFLNHYDSGVYASPCPGPRHYAKRGFGHHLYYSQICPAVEALPRGSVISTFNPYVVDMVLVVDAADIQRRFIIVSGAEARNMTDDEAKRVIDAYNSGVPQLSEVLRFEGVW